MWDAAPSGRWSRWTSASSLAWGLAQYGLASPQEDEEEPEPVRGDTEDGTASMALVIAQTERDTYKRMYESLLARMTMEREETA